MFELGLHSDLCCTEKEVYRTEGEGAHSWDGPVKPPTPACLLENLGGLGLSIIILSWRGVRDTTSPPARVAVRELSASVCPQTAQL